MALLLATCALAVGCGYTAHAPAVKEVPAAREGTTPPTAPKTSTPSTMADFLTEVFGLVDGYWRATLRLSGWPEPSVRYSWIGPGQHIESGCGVLDDQTAAYCPPDETIYVGQPFAFELWAGRYENLPGTGRAYGDFAVAYTIAHEYGHYVQHELGLYDARGHLPTKQFELQADCFAGTWANSAYHQGLLEPGDVEEGIATAHAVGDFEPQSPDSHGTPNERATALLAGYNTGSVATCLGYVPL